MQANDIRKGMVILFDGDLCKVMDFRHHTPGNLRAMVQAKLRNLRTGSQFEHRFRSNDDIEQAFITQHEMEYMYSDGHAHHFMNTENFEQVEIGEEDLGDAAAWLEPGVKLQVQLPRRAQQRLRQTAIAVSAVSRRACRSTHVRNRKGSNRSEARYARAASR